MINLAAWTSFGRPRPVIHPFLDAKTCRKVDVVYFGESRGGKTILYMTSSTSFDTLDKMRLIGEIWSRIWSIGSTPQHIISALEFANEGKTQLLQLYRVCYLGYVFTSIWLVVLCDHRGLPPTTASTFTAVCGSVSTSAWSAHHCQEVLWRKIQILIHSFERRSVNFIKDSFYAQNSKTQLEN